MKPMLLTEYPDKIDLINKQEYVFIQPKLDGWRGMINTKTGQIFSREGKEISLPHITKEILSISDLPEWIDGELYVHGFTLGQIQSMIRKADERIEFHCFDFVSDESFSKRFFHNNKSARIYKHIKSAETHMIKPSEIIKYYDEFISMGYEGAVIRLDNMPYQQYRSEQVIKLKPELMEI